MTGPSQWRKAVIPKTFYSPVPFFCHVCNRRHHAPSPRTHILPIILVNVISSLNMGLHQYFGQCDLAIHTYVDGPRYIYKNNTATATAPWLKTPGLHESQI